MSIYKINELTFTYTDFDAPALKNISLEINEGEFIVVCGQSGCGKTTLLRQLKTCLSGAGIRSGEVLFKEKPLGDTDERTQAQKIGFVMQDVENQLVTDKVWHELAFGLEGLGCKNDEIRKRVAEMASFFGIQNQFRKNVAELSGGQKQLLNLASVMVMRPEVLILDEPTAQLDPIAAERFLEMVAKINRETGTTIILSEHRLEEALPLCSRVVVMDKGAVICDAKPSEVAGLLRGHELADIFTSASRIYGAVEGVGEYPVTVRDGREWLFEYVKKHELREIRTTDNNKEGEVSAELRDVWFRYSSELDDVSRGVSLKAYKGELLCIVGGNGTGKTTVLSLLSGLNRPYRGRVLINGTPINKVKNLYDGVIGVVPQNPKTLFVKKTLHEELTEMLPRSEEREARVMGAARLCGLEGLLQRHPYDLSGGEQQRAALAKILLRNPHILLLDEPTKGMDAGFKRELAAILKSLTEHGRTIIMVSHDIEFCAEYADRCAMLFDGEVTASGDPHEFFMENMLYTTAAGRIARGIIPDAVTVGDVIFACTGRYEKRDTIDADEIYYKENIKKEPEKRSALKKYLFGEEAVHKTVRADTKLSMRTRLALWMMLLFIPLTIFTGVYYLDDKRYYFVSLLVVIEAMLPFAMVYESRKPKPREIVTIAALCAITVAGRTAFFWLPQFKPVVAMVIISGAAFGGEAGFLVGAMSAFVSNFFFGQGPWTPWQMFAFGMIGFLSGILIRKGILTGTRLPMSVFGGLATLIIYGGIINPANILITQHTLTKELVIAAYISGFPFDLIHAASTVIFLWLAYVPMMEKLDRIKKKYNIIY